MINEILSTILQITFFALIPLTVYLIQKKQFKGFWNYIGLQKSNAKANGLAFAASITFFLPLFLLTVFNEDFQAIMFDPDSMTGKFRTMEFSAKSLVVLLVAAILKTALAEEILFRGFIAKRLIAVTNYQTGNLLQAFLFGMLHSLLFLSISKNPLFLIVIFLIPALGAYVSVYLNEKVANGSIIPSWISHATSNLLSYSLIGWII